MQLDQLRALRASVDAGTLDGAARLLGLTPSAVSQRLRALETATGRVLLVRSRPVRVTPSGEAVLRLARQVEALVADTAAELGGGAVPVVPVAVNADSLATWFLPAVAPLAGEIAFDLHRADESRTADLLRDGTVMAAVTVDATPVAGCRVTSLGVLRYRVLATPAFAQRWFPGGWERAPVVVFDRTDDLQDAHLRRRGVDPAAPPRHLVPSSADFVDAVRLGMGWGMVPDVQRPPGLVDLDPDGAADVTLHWQQWRLRSAALDRVAAAVLAAGRAALERPAAERSAGGRGSAVASRPSDEAAEAGSRRLEP
jgi:LysR family transcriptional regulator (chromosome initiation inhibitor)